jgi:hypothetical protein
MARFENVGVFVQEKVWLRLFSSQTFSRINTPIGRRVTLSPSFLLAQAIFEPNLFPYKYPNILKSSHSSYLLIYEDGTYRVF